ncbi:hypothetical protein EXIGLDRAFT_717743 [Exidia glandulosa HHB12029]|uniref:Uncharacterized protein n=1 Tax=Exidia glandulosa HHB12029 TaxID=1314781 RepID=A0A165YZZ5_EXIGL|nr:hypothetical protein EXIGLDRAFT_717743 [Exidia glandulosa HHB12029]
MCRRPPPGVDAESSRADGVLNTTAVLISAVCRRRQRRRTVCARSARAAHTAPDAGLDVG